MRKFMCCGFVSGSLSMHVWFTACETLLLLLLVVVGRC
jgi:hypothetical protein